MVATIIFAVVSIFITVVSKYEGLSLFLLLPLTQNHLHSHDKTDHLGKVKA